MRTLIHVRETNDWDVLRLVGVGGRGQEKVADVEQAFEPWFVDLQVLGRCPQVEARHHERFVLDGDDGTYPVGGDELAAAHFADRLGHQNFTGYRFDVLSTSRRLQ